MAGGRLAWPGAPGSEGWLGSECLDSEVSCSGGGTDTDTDTQHS